MGLQWSLNLKGSFPTQLTCHHQTPKDHLCVIPPAHGCTYYICDCASKKLMCTAAKCSDSGMEFDRYIKVPRSDSE